MYKVSIEPHWRIAYGKKPSIDTAMLLRLLDSIQTEGAILQAAKAEFEEKTAEGYTCPIPADAVPIIAD